MSNHPLHCAHHFANVLFNGMRGGIFADQYRIDTQDLKEFIAARSRTVLTSQGELLASLGQSTDIFSLYSLAQASGSADLLRLSYSYLPLSFSRRCLDQNFRSWRSKYVRRNGNE